LTSYRQSQQKEDESKTDEIGISGGMNPKDLKAAKQAALLLTLFVFFVVKRKVTRLTESFSTQQMD